MQLDEYLQGKPRGTTARLAARLGITKTWMSLIVSRRRKPSPELAVLIEEYTEGKVKRRDLLPEIFS